MNRTVITCLALTAAITIFTMSSALALAPAELAGSWESVNPEEGTKFVAEFFEEGVFDLKIYDFETMEYRIDKELGKVGMVQPAWDDEDEERIDWVSFKVKGSLLTVFADEMELNFERVWKPEQTTHSLVGRWVMSLEEGDEMWEEGVPQEFAIQFNNDGLAEVYTLDESLVGDYTINDGGIIELGFDDETGEGVYSAKDDSLVITVDNESFTFTRVV